MTQDPKAHSGAPIAAGTYTMPVEGWGVRPTFTPPVVDLQPGQVLPGLYDAEFSDGSIRTDLTTGQIWWLLNGR